MAETDRVASAQGAAKTGQQDIATLTPALKSPQADLILKMQKLLDAYPEAAQHLAELALAEGGLQPHHLKLIEKVLAAAGPDVSYRAAMQAFQLSLQQNNALNAAFNGPAIGMPFGALLAALEPPSLQPQLRPAPRLAAPSPFATLAGGMN